MITSTTVKRALSTLKRSMRRPSVKAAREPDFISKRNDVPLLTERQKNELQRKAKKLFAAEKRQATRAKGSRS